MLWNSNFDMAFIHRHLPPLSIVLTAGGQSRATILDERFCVDLPPPTEIEEKGMGGSYGHDV